MKKLFTALLLSIFPALVLADSSLSFAPPATDYSVVFLGNLFGLVDGVLHGTGSQIMGAMFGVFNAAVLTVGGVIIMYTLMVATMNTAHEGQMLGQKWSSIWIPVRSTLGLALLIPKASGYCLMQIFVMWVVLQGVGAADKVWEAALSYLNRGGVIIKAQADPTLALTSAGDNGVSKAGAVMLSGQVCMLGLQNRLEDLRQRLLDQAKDGGPCKDVATNSVFYTICTKAIPDFVGSVNMVTRQDDLNNAAKKLGGIGMNKYSVSMPNLPATDPYSFLNGKCGKLEWNPLEELGGDSAFTNKGTGGVENQIISKSGNAGIDTINQTLGASGLVSVGVSLNADELNTAQLSRAIAMQQMYTGLTSVAQQMVDNDPELQPPPDPTVKTTKASEAAEQQFGVPYTVTNTVCQTSTKLNPCVLWGTTATEGALTSGGFLFRGNEFQGAIADYNGIMMPTLNLIKQASKIDTGKSSRAFIKEANSRGWIMAGSYFFDLVKLNGNAIEDQDMSDKNTGMENSAFDSRDIVSTFEDNCTNALCLWFGDKGTELLKVKRLIDGTGIATTTGTDAAMGFPDTKTAAITTRTLVPGARASTVFGFINNSMMMTLPGQPGVKATEFANVIKFSVDTTPYMLTAQDFDCGRVWITVFSFCFGEMMGNLFYNIIFLFIYNTFMLAFQNLISSVIMAFLMIPLQGMAEIFKTGLHVIDKPGVNPIVALANMGTMYINFAGNLWMTLLGISVTSALIPVFGVFIFALLSLAMPLILAWIGVMLTVGFTTAYYIPLLPYMIFTFGSIAWLITVIEAMVAAPIVALGITHPEGHDAFGKGEAAVMILMNVFLRPAMMIIGYISAIALSYVGVWILNAGYDHAVGFIHGDINPGGAENAAIRRADVTGSKYDPLVDTFNQTQVVSGDTPSPYVDGGNAYAEAFAGKSAETLEKEKYSSDVAHGGYKEWAGIYAFFFSILTYTTMYLVIVQRAFTLISYLPDKVLRWIGGSPESIGSESAQWGDKEMKEAHSEAGKGTKDAQGQMGKQMGGGAQKGMGGIQGGGESAASGGGSTKGSGGGKGKDGGGGGVDASEAAEAIGESG